VRKLRFRQKPGVENKIIGIGRVSGAGSPATLHWRSKQPAQTPHRAFGCGPRQKGTGPAWRSGRRGRVLLPLGGRSFMAHRDGLPRSKGTGGQSNAGRHADCQAGRRKSDSAEGKRDLIPRCLHERSSSAGRTAPPPAANPSAPLRTGRIGNRTAVAIRPAPAPAAPEPAAG